MGNKFTIFLLISLTAFGTMSVLAQQSSEKKKLKLAVGVAKTVGAQKIVLETKTGMLDAVLTKSSAFFRLPPDNLKLSAATESKLEDISIGDRVLVTGTFSDDKKTLFAVKIYLVKGSDIAERQEKQRQEWRKRGISGRVKAVDVTNKIITVEMRSITGTSTTLQITPKDGIKYLRYSPESVKYSDAKKSDFSTIQKDDMIQALGDKSVGGKSFKAEEILTGAFVTVAGKVKSVDTEKNEVTITDLKTKKEVTIAVKSTSLVKRFPAEIAQRMARRMMRQKMGDGGVRPPNSEKRGGNGQGNSAGQRRAGGREGSAGRGGGRVGTEINQMLNRFPNITVAELKAGEMIAVSSPKGTDVTRLTAIKLLAGVEPFVALANARAKRSGGRGRGGVRGGLTIPGLNNVQF